MWTYIQASPGMGLEAQHVLRLDNAPVAVLKKAPGPGNDKDRWALSLLRINKVAADTILVLGSLVAAKAAAERMARERGWGNGAGSEELRQDAAE